MQCWARVIFLSTRHALPRPAVIATCHASPRCFFKNLLRVITVSRHAPRVIFFKGVIKKRRYVLTLLVANLTPPHPSGHLPPLLACGQTHPSPPSCHPPPLLVANLTPPAQRSYSTPTAAVKLSPLRPAVILHPCWWQTSTLPPATEDERQETGDRRRETRDKRRETGDKRREMGDGRREMRCGKG